MKINIPRLPTILDIQSLTVNKLMSSEDISKKINDYLKVTKTHTGEKQYGCTVCGKQDISKTPIILHIELHLNIDHSCTKCETVKKTRSDLKLHMFNAHNN